MDILLIIKKRKRILIKTLVVVLALIVLGYGLLQLSKSRTFQFFGTIIHRVNTQEKIVALTFDDAPSENVNNVLQILKEKNVKATFYVIGSEIEKYPEIAKKIVRNDHEIGNHSYSHKRMVFKTDSFVADEITRTNELIRSLGFVGDITFRPPNGKKLLLLPWYLAQNNIATIMWDVEPDTYYQGDSEKIAKYILDNVQPGSIILLHPFCNSECEADRAALPIIIDGLRSKGYSFVTINNLLSYKQ